MNRITTKEFIQVFKDIHKHSTDKKFCFILGAGASKTSGIPTGEEMSKMWYEEIKEMLDSKNLEKWKTEFNIREDNLSHYYGLIYQRRFLHNYPSGYDYLNQSMKNAKPGFGYSVIAQLLSTTKHNIVITTNFDSLTEEALYRYSYRKFLVCGHESLTGFATPSIERPLIAKIHRDLLMNPQNRPDETSELAEGWKNALDNIFKTYIPVIIGYGGNDGSLMGYFENLDTLDNVFWCCMKNSKISDRINNLLTKYNGKLVETDGFDNLMYDICIASELGFLNTTLLKVAQDAARDYENSVNEIIDFKSNSADPKNIKSVSDFSRMAKGDTAFDHYLRIAGENDIAKKDKLFAKALKKFPESAELNGFYAVHLQSIKKKYNEAEKYYKKAFTLDPSNSKSIGDYAHFLQFVRRKYDEAEKYYKKSLALDPNSKNANGNYAFFLHVIRKNYAEADKYFKKALILDPNNPMNNGNYAAFLDELPEKYDEAEMFYKKSLAVDLYNPINAENYAIFLNEKRKNYPEAEKYFKIALELHSDDAANNGNYAQMLLGLGRKEEGEKYLNKAFESAGKQEPLLIELWFYRYCHFPEFMKEAERNIESLLKKGVRSPARNFPLNTERAKIDKHPDIKRVKQLEQMICNQDAGNE